MEPTAKYKVVGNTSQAKDQIKTLPGARWDKIGKCWWVNSTAQIKGVSFIPQPLPEGWIIECSRYLGSPLSVNSLDYVSVAKDKYMVKMDCWTERDWSGENIDHYLLRPVTAEEQQALDIYLAKTREQIEADIERRESAGL